MSGGTRACKTCGHVGCCDCCRRTGTLKCTGRRRPPHHPAISGPPPGGCGVTQTTRTWIWTGLCVDHATARSGGLMFAPSWLGRVPLYSGVVHRSCRAPREGKARRRARAINRLCSLMSSCPPPFCVCSIALSESGGIAGSLPRGSSNDNGPDGCKGSWGKRKRKECAR